MINLKRNDKIIIIVAVIVLILAGIGIAAYTPEDVGDRLPEEELNTYTVDWDIRTGSIQSMSEFAGKKSPYEGTIQINQRNLKTVTFNLSWMDDKTTLLGRAGLDTLTLEITTPDGEIREESQKSASKSKTGNIMMDFSVSNGIPSNQPIEAMDMYEAEEELQNNESYYHETWSNEDFTITVYVKVGELRPLKKLLKKGNSFKLDVSYEYYYPTPIEEEGENKTMDESENPFEDLEEEYMPPYVSMILSTGCGRFI